VLSAERSAHSGKIKARNYRIGSAARQFLPDGGNNDGGADHCAVS